jgi:uncharacterized membrane protein YgaE (UPF0421/DUF939 family)
LYSSTEELSFHLPFEIAAPAAHRASTLAIIVLIPRPDAPWIIAMHRFLEVSVGIVVALAVVVVWREEEPLPARTPEE